MLVGTAEVVREPVEKTVFVEDLSAADAAKAGERGKEEAHMKVMPGFSHGHMPHRFPGTEI